MRSLIDSRTEPGSHVRESLEARHYGLLNNYRSPILKPPQFLDIDEVLQLLPAQASASIFVELPYAPFDTVQHRTWSALQADKRLPTRNTFFSGSDLLRLFAHPVRASVLRDSHYYPFLIRSAPILVWLESALLELVTNFFPTQEDPLPSPSPPRPALFVSPCIATSAGQPAPPHRAPAALPMVGTSRSSDRGPPHLAVPYQPTTFSTHRPWRCPNLREPCPLWTHYCELCH